MRSTEKNQIDDCSKQIVSFIQKKKIKIMEKRIIMNYYFAYGSNLHHLQMKRRCPNCRFIKKIILYNYSLSFRSKYGAADIEKKIGGKKFMEHCI